MVDRYVSNATPEHLRYVLGTYVALTISPWAVAGAAIWWHEVVGAVKVPGSTNQRTARLHLHMQPAAPASPSRRAYPRGSPTPRLHVLPSWKCRKFLPHCPSAVTYLRMRSPGPSLLSSNISFLRTPYASALIPGTTAGPVFTRFISVTLPYHSAIRVQRRTMATLGSFAKKHKVTVVGSGNWYDFPWLCIFSPF